MIRYFSRLLILAWILTTAIAVLPAAAESPADFPPEFRWAVPNEVGVHAFSVAIDDQDNIYATDPINHSVWKFLPDGSRLSRWGSAGTGPGEFTAPMGVAVNSSGYLYVTDIGRVQVFNPDGNYVTAWGSAGNGTGEFNRVIGIAVNKSGYVYTSETGTNRIQVFTRDGTFVTSWGSAGSGAGEFNNPMSIAVNNRFVFVADQFNNRVQVFDPSGIFMQSWNSSGSGPGSGNGEFSFPQAVTVSGNGSVYVGDAGNRRVQVFDQAGRYVTQFPSSIGLGIAVNSTGYAYLTDYSYDRIQVFAPDGSAVSSWGARGDGEGKFFHPWGVAVNASGYSFVTDSENHRIQVYSPEGDYTGQWGSQGSGDGQFLLPLGIAVNGSGFVFVADSTNNRVQVFDPFHGYVTQWGSFGTGAGQLFDPRGIAVNGSGFVYVTETGNSRVQVFSDDGVSLGFWGSQGSGAGQFNGPMGIAINSSGYVFVCENGNNRVQVFNPSGAYLMQMGSAGSGNGMLSSPTGVAADASGRVLVADSGNNRIQVFDEFGGDAGQWGSQGTTNGQFYAPAGISADSQGNVVVAELYNDRIQKFAFAEQPLPAPYIWASTQSGDAPLSVGFTGYSEGSPLNWSWRFGDGEYAGGRNATHTYLTPGVYTVNLTVAYPDGVNTTSMDNMITVMGSPVPAPVILAYPWSGEAPLTVNFMGFSDGSPLNWSWSFGDGQYAGGRNATHTYLTPGIYTINLTVLYPNGVNTTSMDNMITVTTPTVFANFTADNTEGNVPLIVGFTDLSAGSPVSWNWSFGDGSFSDFQYPSYTYTMAGNYTVNLTVSDAGGNTSSISRPAYILVRPGPPIPYFVAYNQAGPAPLTVRFWDASLGSPTSWNWSFGDGSLSHMQNPNHTYLAPGQYTVSLTETNSYGMNTTTIADMINVTAPVEPVFANFTANKTAGRVPLAVKFTDQSTGSPNSWVWNFGDGANSTLRNPGHTYTAAGNYTVSLTINGALGTNTSVRQAYIQASPATNPVAAFIADRTSGRRPLTVKFTDQSTGSPTSWAWTFGDGTTSSLRNPSHTYTRLGVFSVSLTAANDQGSSTKTRSYYIWVTPW